MSSRNLPGDKSCPGSWTSCRMNPRVRLLAFCSGLALAPLHSDAFTIEFQRRDSQTGAITKSVEEIDPKRIGVIAVDMWNWHWCKTSTERVAALVPRMNKCLEQARALGMTVFLCPTDVADNYVGTPMVERVIAVDPEPVPEVVNPTCP